MWRPRPKDGRSANSCRDSSTIVSPRTFEVFKDKNLNRFLRKDTQYGITDENWKRWPKVLETFNHSNYLPDSGMTLTDTVSTGEVGGGWI
jgi:hypothetical protein